MDHWIVADAEHLGGSPRVRGTRISVALILESLAAGMSIAQIVDAYPSLTEESVRRVLAELAHRKDLQPALRRAATSFCGKFSSSRIFQRRLRSGIGSYATVAGIGQRKLYDSLATALIFASHVTLASGILFARIGSLRG